MSDLWKNEPALIIGFIQAVFVVAVSFGLQLTPEQIGAITGVMAAIFALITRQNVSRPATAETLAKGALLPKPTPEQADKAATILGVPPQLIQDAVKFAAMGLLPSTWASLIVGTDFSRLLVAVNEARRRAPTQSETDAKAMEGV